MPALQVRDFPDDLYVRLKESAARNHRSIAQQTIACVEAQLNQEERRGTIIAPDFEQGPTIPQNVREAAERAQFVDPYDWLHDFEEEPEEVIEARRKKRRMLREKSKKVREGWIGPVPTPDEIAQMIRDEREARTNRILECVEDYQRRVMSDDGA